MEWVKKFNESKIGQIFQYSLIKYVALGFGFIKGIINAKFLGPELLGILGNLTLVLGYCSYANLGVLNSMNREYVLYKDKNNEKAQKVLNTAFTFLILISSTFLLFSIGALFIYRNIYGVYLALIFIIAIFDQFRSYYTNYFRLHDNYKLINLIEVIYSIISFVITIILIHSLKIFGVLIAMLICGIVILIVGFIKTKNIKFGIDKQILKILIEVGIPLLIYNLGFYILTTIDRWIIIKYYTQVDLGYYTFANSMVSATLVFVSSMLFLLYPKVIKSFNEEQSSNIVEKVKIYTRILEIASAIFFTIGIVVFKPFIEIFLNKYINSIGIYMLLLLAVIASNLGYFSNCYIVSNKKQRFLVYLQGFSIIINLTFNMLFWKLGLGVQGVALGTLVANILYALIQYIIFIKLTTGRSDFGYCIKVYGRILIYSLYVSLMVILEIDYIWYVISGIILTIVLYGNEVRKIKDYIRVIKGD